MEQTNEGYVKGEICNRDGCKGIIEENEKEGSCSCHNNPPCSYCTTPSEYCPECGWDAYDELMDSYNKFMEKASKEETKPKYVYKSSLELFNELKDNEFGYVRTAEGGSVVRIKGKHPNMSSNDIYKKLGLAENPNMPRMKFYSTSTFELTYFCD